MDITRQRKESIQLLQEVRDSRLLAQSKQLIIKEKDTTIKVEKPKFMKYVTTIHKKTDIEAIFKNYKQPDLSKVVGVLPTDEPLEELIKQ